MLMAGSKNKKSVAEHSLVFMKYRLLKEGLLCEIVSYVVPGKKKEKIMKDKLCNTCLSMVL